MRSGYSWVLVARNFGCACWVQFLLGGKAVTSVLASRVGWCKQGGFGRVCSVDELDVWESFCWNELLCGGRNGRAEG